jgi:phage-related protein (TIGR01555 family)
MQRPAFPRRPKVKIDASVLAKARQRYAQDRSIGGVNDPFKLPAHPKGVVPEGAKTLAMDSDITFQQQWAAASYASGAAAFSSVYQEGLAFPGYSYLAALAQRPEYRRFAEIIATEMTRRWIKVKSVSDDDEAKAGKIRELNDELDRLDVRGVFRKIAEQDAYFGRGHVYLDTGSTDNRDELKTPIGNGRNTISRNKFGGRRDFLERLTAVEAVWVYPTNYDSNDPLKPSWYEPSTWFVMGKEVHVSRLLKFVGREVPDLLKPAYSFGGLSMSQMAKPYVDNWLRTRQSVADIIHAFSVFVLSTDLSESLTEGGSQLFARAELFNLVRDNRGIMMINQDTEGFANVSAPLGSLDALQAQTQEHLASVSGIPIIKLLGIQPAGLNSSSEGEIRTFYDWIHAFQEKFFRPNLTKVIDFAQLSLWGEVDQDLTFEFEPLWSLDEKAQAEVREIDARTDQLLADTGVVRPEEIRAKVAADPNSGFNALDADDAPNLRQEEEEGLEPKSGAAKLAQEPDEDEGGEPQEADRPEKPKDGGQGGEAPGPLDEGEDADESEGGLSPDYLKDKAVPLDKDRLKQGAVKLEGDGRLDPDRLRKKDSPLDPDHLRGKSPLDGEGRLDPDYLKS